MVCHGQVVVVVLVVDDTIVVVVVDAVVILLPAAMGGKRRFIFVRSKSFFDSLLLQFILEESVTNELDATFLRIVLSHKTSDSLRVFIASMAVGVKLCS